MLMEWAAFSTRDLQTALAVLQAAQNAGPRPIEAIKKEVSRRQSGVDAQHVTPSTKTCTLCGKRMVLCPQSTRMVGAPVYYCRCGYSEVGR